MQAWLRIGAVALMLVGEASAGALEDAGAARARGELDLAAKLVEAAALQGIAEAQVLIGEAKTVASPAEAVKWFRLAADQGNAEAPFKLAQHYFLGLGLPKDSAEGVKWMQLSADRGWPQAQGALAHYYDDGREGVAKNQVLAHKWYNLAASSALRVLEQSPPLKRDEVEYFKYVKQQAEIARDHLANDMTPAQLAEAYRLAGEWKPSK